MPPQAEAQADSERSLRLVREAMTIRAGGDLAGAVTMLHDKVNLADPYSCTIYLRLLNEIQDHATLQVQTRQALTALASTATDIDDTEYVLTVLYAAERASLPVRFFASPLARLFGHRPLPPRLVGALNALRQRLKFRADLAGRYAGSCSIISLGLNCLPWHLLGRWGLRRPRDYMSLFVPFSLAGHTVKGTIDALEDDFANYCTTETVRAVTSQRGHEFVLRKDRGAFWNHNRGAYWLADDMAALRANNAAKAAAFRDACRRPDAVFLLATCPVQYPEEPLDFLPRLDAALGRFTGRRANRIIISNQTTQRDQPTLHSVNDHVSFFYCPYPSKDYVWHDEVAADTKEGLIFERTYMKFLLRILVAWGLYERRTSALPADATVAAAAAAAAA